MSSDTPIFDQLIDEFNSSGMYVFGFVYPDEVADEPEENDLTRNTLYDATHLKAIVVKPAIPEYDKANTEETVVMEAVREPVEAEESVAGPSDQELTESFQAAVVALDNGRKEITDNEHVKAIIKTNVTPIRRNALPRRKNKRGAANSEKHNSTFSYFTADTDNSPESAA
jgi:hypothetical protein